MVETRSQRRTRIDENSKKGNFFRKRTEGLRSFVEVYRNSDFPLENLPFGIFSPTETAEAPRPGVAIGDYVLDLSVIATAGLFNNPDLERCFNQTTLNIFLEMGRPAWKEARATIQKLLSANEPLLRDNVELREKSLLPMSGVEMRIPVEIGDYVDVCTMQHAENCGLFSGESDSSADPNWFQLPITYRRGESPIFVSGTNIVRPRGKGPKVRRGEESAYLAPTRKLDYGLKMAAVVGSGSGLGQPLEPMDHIFGLVLINDWTARDIKAREEDPLGPILGKTFCTTISPWIVTLEALQPFACDAPQMDQPLPPFLDEKEHLTYDISLEVCIERRGHESYVGMNHLNFLPWTLTQLLALQTAKGCPLSPGDLIGTGIISRWDRGMHGCLLERARDPEMKLYDDNGSPITFLEDGDVLMIRGACRGKGYVVGFGDCDGAILPALPPRMVPENQLNN